MTKSALVFLVVLLTGTVHGGCDAEDGPAGSYECVLLEPYYNKYQWATCLTDTYIGLVSKGRHQCLDRTRVYCYYQCMIEIHDRDSGPVFDDCACGRDAPTEVTTPATRSTSAIPDWCFSPDGKECSWYRNCLEKRYPCKDEENSYALEYAEKFCDLYTKNYQHFDSTGQRWIDAVRKCLQVELVPILRPFVHKSCAEIKEIAFNSHPGCYVNPSDDEPSICDIGVRNMFQVFWTVKGAIIQAPDDTLSQMLTVSDKCGWNYELLDLGMTVLVFGLGPVQGSVLRAGLAIVRILASERQWDRKGVTYYAYPKSNDQTRERRSAEDNSTVVSIVNIILAPKGDYDLNSEFIGSINVTEEAYSTAKAIANKEVKLLLSDEQRPLTLNVCGDFNCTETLLSVKVPEYDEQKEDNSGTAIIVTVSSIVVGQILIAVVVYIARKKFRMC